MSRAVRGAAGVLAVLAAGAVLVATWRHLQVDLLLDGTGPGYRLPQLLVAAVAGGAVVVCAAAVRAAARSARLGPLLLAGPVLLAALALGAALEQETVVYDGSYVPLKGVTMTQAYGSQLSIGFDGSVPQDAALLALAVATGVLLAAAALRPRPTR